jgi:hypothetical protein
MLLVLIQYTHHVSKQSISGGLLKRQDRCNDKKKGIRAINFSPFWLIEKVRGCSYYNGMFAIITCCYQRIKNFARRQDIILKLKGEHLQREVFTTSTDV